jgi:hypothetical protein
MPVACFPNGAKPDKQVTDTNPAPPPEWLCQFSAAAMIIPAQRRHHNDYASSARPAAPQTIADFFYSVDADHDGVLDVRAPRVPPLALICKQLQPHRTIVTRVAWRGRWRNS